MLIGSLDDSTVFSTICFNGSVIGRGLLNKAINALPFELHIPGYQFCGPGTRLEKRLARDDRGINPLDTACREHDIAYTRSSKEKKKNVHETLKIPTGVTTNVQLLQLAKRMRIPYFRGIFMRTTLPVEGVHRNESGFVNLDNAEGPGTHWVAYAKRGNRVIFRQFW
ncbi:hypothetical protein ALC62_10261 [Cyphomyrmex costatus]|uniref:Phospholipase A2-like domain-containing protein n=1 Tax=Cyphomyrmex costatus TaxID=456900 RepID=A0A151IEA4_9HYME|nr:hypothetical protein ALC62_10261 [Cyphomyrmex costatus]